MIKCARCHRKQPDDFSKTYIKLSYQGIDFWLCLDCNNQFIQWLNSK